MKSKNNHQNFFENPTEEIESWIIERRKFFIKLTWVVGLILILLIIANFI